jgi:hypothetical protein
MTESDESGIALMPDDFGGEVGPFTQVPVVRIRAEKDTDDDDDDDEKESGVKDHDKQVGKVESLETSGSPTFVFESLSSLSVSMPLLEESPSSTGSPGPAASDESFPAVSSAAKLTGTTSIASSLVSGSITQGTVASVLNQLVDIVEKRNSGRTGVNPIAIRDRYRLQLVQAEQKQPIGASRTPGSLLVQKTQSSDGLHQDQRSSKLKSRGAGVKRTPQSGGGGKKNDYAIIVAVPPSPGTGSASARGTDQGNDDNEGGGSSKPSAIDSSEGLDGQGTGTRGAGSYFIEDQNGDISKSITAAEFNLLKGIVGAAVVAVTSPVTCTINGMQEVENQDDPLAVLSGGAGGLSRGVMRTFLGAPAMLVGGIAKGLTQVATTVTEKAVSEDVQQSFTSLIDQPLGDIVSGNPTTTSADGTTTSVFITEMPKDVIDAFSSSQYNIATGIGAGVALLVAAPIKDTIDGVNTSEYGSLLGGVMGFGQVLHTLSPLLTAQHHTATERYTCVHTYI